MNADMGRSVGDVAETLGLSPDTLRYYERKGVLPEPPRDAAGRRHYTADDVHLIEVLLRLKETGMPLAEVAAFTAYVDRDPECVPERLTLLEQHRERVVEQRRRLDRALELIDRKIADYRGRG